MLGVAFWLWIAVAALFAIIEFFTVTFFGLWMAIAALVPALLVAADLSLQLISWALASLLCAGIWIRWIRSKPQSNLPVPLIGQEGILATSLAPGSEGRILFSKPIQSRQEWPCFSQQTLPRQTRVCVVAVAEQQRLEVIAVQPVTQPKEL